ncbi:STAS-like domain-containing protein [Vibrio vulnificus]|uniref:STAS-like domain-containing protein n=1 Tax=Vibrio vulnificus TaxID=672 RepID=UPI00102B2B8B|nr:STAS-like domain-containing protein [Vibrio vulnificus]MCA3991410.1 STAS-like domain-containing protein [Vibrio vulnificus]RZQ90308.1 DUF4325 domain-containing protein [Vibrio vulnificus]
MIEVRVTDFTQYPGPRYMDLGPNSGEEFRLKFLLPALKKDKQVRVILDGVFGYGSSFLEEAFGGLVRSKEVSREQIEFLKNHLISEEDPSYIDEVKVYIDEALEA